jgi:hypothetical protein
MSIQVFALSFEIKNASEAPYHHINNYRISINIYQLKIIKE